jgi:hypothetical protein
MTSYRVRDVESDEPGDYSRVEAFDAETAAAKIVEEWFGEREYYSRVNNGEPVRIAVRDGDGPEEIYAVTIELTPSAYARAEVFTHPTKPPALLRVRRPARPSWLAVVLAGVQR